MTLNSFLDTLMSDPPPQCLVWLPLMHRLANVENGKSSTIYRFFHLVYHFIFGDSDTNGSVCACSNFQLIKIVLYCFQSMRTLSFKWLLTQPDVISAARCMGFIRTVPDSAWHWDFLPIHAGSQTSFVSWDRAITRALWFISVWLQVLLQTLLHRIYSVRSKEN